MEDGEERIILLDILDALVGSLAVFALLGSLSSERLCNGLGSLGSVGNLSLGAVGYGSVGYGLTTLLGSITLIEL